MLSCLASRLKMIAVNKFDLERMKKSLCDRIIITISRRTHTLDALMPRKDFTETLATVLKPSIRMNDQPGLRPTIQPCCTESCHHQVISQPLLHTPPDNAPGIHVEYDRQIQPAFLRGDIRDIRGPDAVGNHHLKTLLQSIRCRFLCACYRCHPKSTALNRLYSHYSHQSRYPVPAATISLATQGMKNPRTAIGLFALLKDFLYRCGQLLIFTRPDRLTALSPCIIPTPSNPHYFAHLLDRILPVVLGYESVYRSGSAEKMATAFFKMSRSRRRRSFSFCNSFNAFSGGKCETSTGFSTCDFQTQSFSKPQVIPSDFSTDRRVRPSSNTRRMASFLNSSEYDRFAIRHTPSPVKYRNGCVSTKSGEPLGRGEGDTSPTQDDFN